MKRMNQCENVKNVPFYTFYAFYESDEKLAWKPILSEILNRTPEPNGLFREIGRSMRPNSWSGSRTDIMQRRSELYKVLFEHKRPEISALAKAGHAELRKEINERRKSEEKSFRTQFDSFE